MFYPGDLIHLLNRPTPHLVIRNEGNLVWFVRPFSAETNCCHYSHCSLRPDSDRPDFRAGDEVEFLPNLYPFELKEFIWLGDRIPRTFHDVMIYLDDQIDFNGKNLTPAFSPHAKLFIDSIVGDRAKIKVVIVYRGIDETWTYYQMFSLNNFKKKVVERKLNLIPPEEIADLASYGGLPDRYPHWTFGLEHELLPLESVKETRQNIFARKIQGIKNVLRRYST